MNNLLTYAGRGLILSGLLHVPAWFLGGMSTLPVLIAGVLYLAIGYGLILQVRLLACVTFVIMLVGMNVALASAVAGAPPVWAWWGIFALDVFVALCLFRHIWRGSQAPLEDP